MSSQNESAALVALLRIGRHPWPAYANLVEQRGSATAVLDQEWGVNPTQTSLFSEDGSDINRLVARATADIFRWKAQGIDLFTVLDPGYPENLRAVHDRPPLVFVAGRLEPQDARSVAVVGAREASPAGLEKARALAGHLGDSGYSVVSGLASGIDTAAHTAALGRGRTVAVIGTGLSRCYPPQNTTLQRQISSECAVVSQFWPDTPPSRRRFPMRNALLSGLALAAVVVEASHASGARTLARLALGHGRPVFMFDSLLEQNWARVLASGPGTYVVRSPDEVTTTVERLASAGAIVA